MELSMESIVHLILAAALIIFVLAIGAFFRTAANEQAEGTCAASVFIKGGVVKTNLDAETELTGCKTETNELKGSESDIRNDLRDAYLRCEKMFGIGSRAQIVRSSGEERQGFCHVCGVYTKEDGQGEITGLQAEIREHQASAGTRRLLDQLVGEQDVQTSDALSLQDPLAIIYFQTLTTEHSFLTSLIEPFSARSMLLGAYLKADSQATSGIVIRPYDATTIRALKCTTVNA